MSAGPGGGTPATPPQPTRPKRPLALRLFMALAAIGLFLIGYQWGNQYGRRGDTQPTLTGVLVRAPEPLPAFTLHGADGWPLGPESLADAWTLLAFARLDGPVGHRVIGRMIEVHNRLAGDRDLQADLQLALISADAIPRLARDFERLSPALHVVTGERDQIAIARAALGAGPGDPVDTPPPLFLVDPGGRLIALFTGTQPAADIATDIEALAAWRALNNAQPEPPVAPASTAEPAHD